MLELELKKVDIADLAAVAGLVFVGYQVLQARRQAQREALFYLHNYLSAPERQIARRFVRNQQHGSLKLDDNSIKHANAVAASYDQAGILIDSGSLSIQERQLFLSSSWGESICDQFELLGPYLHGDVAPGRSGFQFFQHFVRLYQLASIYHPKFMIISGGQTGVDRGALEAARELGIPLAGWCPHDGMTEVGEDIRDDYPELRATTDRHIDARTKLNVYWGTHTLIVNAEREGQLDGTKLTSQFAAELGKPHLHVNLPGYPDDEIVAWLKRIERPRIILNIAGPRESNSPAIEPLTKALLRTVIPRIKKLIPAPKLLKTRERLLPFLASTLR